MDDTTIPELSPEERKKAKTRAKSLRYRLRYPERIKANNEKRLSRAAMSEEERARQRTMARTRVQADKDKKHAQDRAYRQKNPAKLREYRRKNRDKINALKRAERLKGSPEEITHRKALASAANKRYRERHPERLRLSAQQQWQNPAKRQKKQAYDAAWVQANPAKVKAKNARRHARKAIAPINDFTDEQWEALCKRVKYRCCYCGKKFPTDKLTPDHLTPYEKQGSNTLHNILPCCGSCNSRKGHRAVLKPVQPFLILSDEEEADED